MTDTPSKAHEEHFSGTEAVEKVRALLKHFRCTMMVTRKGADLHSRPMTLLGDAEDFDDTLWFFTDNRSGKLDEIAGGQPVWLLFQSDDKSAYLELAGRASEIEDRKRMAEFYTPLMKTWFPDGLEDPHLGMLRFDAESGRFWESPGGMLQVLAAFTKSALTGTPGKAGNTGSLSL